MAYSKSAKKAARVTVRRTEINRRVISTLRTSVKKARQAIESGDVAEAQSATRQAVITLDKARGYIHLNKVARTKSRLVRQLNAVVAKATPPPPPQAQEECHQSFHQDQDKGQDQGIVSKLTHS